MPYMQGGQPAPAVSDYMLQLSGPTAQKAPLLATLAGQGIDVDNAHEPRGFDTDPTEGWIVARHGDVDEVAELAKNAGWSLRAHWPTPQCQACAGTTQGIDGQPCSNCNGTGKTEKVS